MACRVGSKWVRHAAMSGSATARSATSDRLWRAIFKDISPHTRTHAHTHTHTGRGHVECDGESVGNPRAAMRVCEPDKVACFVWGLLLASRGVCLALGQPLLASLCFLCAFSGLHCGRGTFSGLHCGRGTVGRDDVHEIGKERGGKLRPLVPAKGEQRPPARRPVRASLQES
jgi:transposase